MRFAVTGEWNRQRALALAVGGWLFFAAIQAATGAALYLQAMGLDPASVVAHYRGDPETFREARTLRGMLEVTHVHALVMGLQLLTLGHLVLFTALPRRLQVGLVATAFACAFAGEAAGWLVWGVSPAFAPVKVLAFVGLQLSQAGMILAVAWALIKVPPEDRAAPAPSRGVQS